MDVAAALANIHERQNVFHAMAMTLAMTAYMFPAHYDVPDGDCFDYIVVGSGSAGSIIATRLSEDPNVRVLLVEAGGDAQIESDIPGYATFMPNSRVDWNYTAIPDAMQYAHKDNRPEIVRGKMLGGCSSINLMLYIRGCPEDYNTWAKITQDDSWKFDNILEYFKKSENLQDDAILKSPTGKFHGTKGYIGVTRLQYNVSQKYLDALAEIGEDIVLDTSGTNSFGYTQPLVNVADGARQSTARAFLGASKDRPNLRVAKFTLVIEIVLDENKNAIGVIAKKQNGEVVMIRALKEVIISAGAINSPQLLMLSGIGPKEHLEDKGIKVISDLPVGENLQDHILSILMYPTEKAPLAKPKNPRDIFAPTIVGYVAMDENKNQPDYQATMFTGDANMALLFCVLFSFNTDICQNIFDETKGKEVMCASVNILRPKSRGSIRLKSSNPLEYPLINLGIYSDKRDIEDSISYVKDFDRISQSTYFQKFNSTLLVPPQCKNLQKGSRLYYECLVRTMVTTIYHHVGTCAMGSVVDSRLRVYGVNRLRIADGSVMPIITSGNPNVPIMMIGEKAADMIKEDNPY